MYFYLVVSTTHSCTLLLTLRNSQNILADAMVNMYTYKCSFVASMRVDVAGTEHH